MEDRVKEEKKFWDKFASQPDVEERIADLPASKFLDQLWPHLPKAGKVLEIGSGTGRLAIPIAREFPKLQVTGLDISPKMTTKAKANAKQRKNIKFVTGNGRDLPKGNFDVIYSMTVFQHIDAEGVKTYIAEAANHLSENGVFIFQYVNGEENSAFSQQYVPEEIASFCADAKLEIFDFKEGVIHPSWNFVYVRKYKGA